jgi:NAD(P)-dependent dehydrogenase (short-subunit alcohol dehydrogenase family)
MLVNNAGTSIRTPAQLYTEPEWHSMLDGNPTSAFLMSQVAHTRSVRADGRQRRGPARLFR